MPTEISGGSVRGRTVPYPLSPLQQGMLFQWQVDPHSGTDVEQIVGDLHERIDTERMEASWQAVLSQFSTLRTSFSWVGLQTPLQHVETAVQLPFAFEDLRSMSLDAGEARVSEFLASDRHQGFDLARPPVMRVQLFQLADAHFRMVWSVHHILLDARSFDVVLSAVFGTYDGTASNIGDRPYSEYIEWIEHQDLAECRAFWRNRLAGFSAPTPIPADLEAGTDADRYHHRWARLSRGTTQQLRELASRDDLTLGTLVMGAWGLMLSRYAAEQDIVFGATRATRRGSIADADAMLGMFLATVPVRLHADPDMSVTQWLHHVRDEWNALHGFEHLPLVDIRQSSDVRTPRLFETLVVYEDYQFGTRLNAQGGAWRARHFGILEQTGFPLTLYAYGDAELALRIEYDSNRFTPTMIDVIMGHLTTLLERWTGATAGPLWSASMLTASEERLVVHEWNATTRDYPRDAFIDELFAEEAARRPDAVAVECGGVSLTYGTLDARASVLAARLAREGVNVGDCVGLFAERSINFVVACVAILKAGAAYLPIEPGYPKDRLVFMIADANARVVLTTRELTAQLHGCVNEAAAPPRIVEIDIGDGAPDTKDPHGANRSAEARSTAIARTGDSGSRVAYVMYTSGSSGLPKGVAVPHRGAVRLVRNTTFMDATSEDAMLGLATTMFDLSTWEIWTALLNGGRLVLLPAGQIDLAKVAELVRSARVTMMWNTPALFQQVVDFGLQHYGTVKLFAIAGDIVPVPHLRRAVSALPGCQFVNGYGPTENSVFTCAYPVPADRPVEDPLPIGPPLSNSTAYVLDAHNAPAAIGVPGELYSGGDGVALGYLNRPELTAERFLHDPFSSDPNARMYRTGDAARWRADGVIEFLGRLDNQVKIRGYRIEPGEVEAVMASLPGVRTAAVAVRKDAAGQKRLLGYYVAEEGKTVTPTDVRTALRALLPDYMIPASIIGLDALPQTNSGKIDRKALPEPSEAENADAELNWRSRPLGRSQKQLAIIWQELLGRASVGIDDDFFEIGGHSLLAVRMMNEAEGVLGRQLALTTLLERPTIRHLARRFDAAVLAEPEPTMVVLRPEGNASPFAFVHGDLTGGGWYCRRLSAMLGEDVPFIVLPTFRPPENGQTWTIETMAAMHVRELQKVQPRGPYRLGGFCAGGLIALEIARVLVRTGHEVERLVLVDVVNENAPVSRWRPFIDRMAPPTAEPNQFGRRQKVLNRFKYYDSRLRAVGAMGPLELVRWAGNTIRVRLPGRRPPGASGSTEDSPKLTNAPKATRPEHENLRFYARSASVYVPQRYAGGVDLVFSSDPDDRATNATDPQAAAAALGAGYQSALLGWRRILPAASVHHIPGPHIGVIVDNLDKLGAFLRGCLSGRD